MNTKQQGKLLADELIARFDKVWDEYWGSKSPEVQEAFNKLPELEKEGYRIVALSFFTKGVIEMTHVFEDKLEKIVGLR